MMALQTTIFAFILLLNQLLHAIAVPLVTGGAGVFDQEFLASAVPGKSSDTDSSNDADSIIPILDDPVESTIYPSWFTTTLMARRILALSTTGVVSTTFPDPLPPHSRAPPGVSGLSVPMNEYIADCDKYLPPVSSSESAEEDEGGEGNPTLLALYLGTTFRNTAAGSNISLTVDWWSHVDSTDPIYPGFPLSAAGLPRVMMFGHLEHLPLSVTGELEKCFLDAHPDALAWAPGKKGAAHPGYWARMIVEQVYWIGGFGDVARIGWLNVTEWKGIREGKSLDGIGDGRGWGDVRLPGEKE